MKKHDFMGVSVPDYGNAPAELVEKHKKLANHMAELYEAGESLSSDTMLELTRQINELNRQIAEYYPGERE